MKNLQLTLLGLFFVSVVQAQDYENGDITKNKFIAILSSYKKWAVENNEKHKFLTSDYRANRSNEDIGILLDKLNRREIDSTMYNTWAMVFGCIRKPNPEESIFFKEVLIKYGYLEDDAELISHRVLIISSELDNYDGIYDADTDIIFIHNNALKKIMNKDVRGEFVLMHKVEHYNYFIGHIKDKQDDVDMVKEEQRAEYEAMCKILKSGKELPEYERVYFDFHHKEQIINKGYISRSPQVRDFVVNAFSKKE